MEVVVSQQMESSPGPEGLAASGPNGQYSDELMLFGQFVGNWEADFTAYGPDGTKQIAKAEWHFGWVLEGRAIQDVFIVPRRSDRAESGWTRTDYGTCLRFYDPAIDGWRVVWVSPGHGEILNFIAHEVGDEIVLEGKKSPRNPDALDFFKDNTQLFPLEENVLYGWWNNMAVA